MKSEISKSVGSGVGWTPKFIRDFSYSLNKKLQLVVNLRKVFPRSFPLIS
jgi:hypothetical protein